MKIFRESNFSDAPGKIKCADNDDVTTLRLRDDK
jgi:hypothetical protein